LRTGADGTQSYIAIAKTQREFSLETLATKKTRKNHTEMHKKDKHQMNREKKTPMIMTFLNPNRNWS